MPRPAFHGIQMLLQVLPPGGLGEPLFAAAYGKIFRIECRDGAIEWKVLALVLALALVSAWCSLCTWSWLAQACYPHLRSHWSA